MMMGSSAIDLVLRYIGYVNAGNREAVYALTHGEVRFIDIQGVSYQEREFMTNYMEAFPEYRIHVQTALHSGNSVALIGTTSGSHVPPEIEKGETLVWIAEASGGRISHWRIYARNSYRSAE